MKRGTKKLKTNKKTKTNTKSNLNTYTLNDYQSGDVTDAFLCFNFARMISMTIGRIEMPIMPKMTNSKLFFTIGRSPKI